ncbi:acetyl-CoA carboxylase biotin carboxyl carrier protein [Parafilimonas terrae]|uniref:Biotin carboxyl carrier protein of acetyl-CoA carboxylase n=1 Tax=Parafilimonas terrae TaxID=1465490 RepID=A0A1I5WMK7_9BACT|nr:acetyl-CoA carboxylase biotin carboxyl carrier protein [Parafilimonas terrae]SFQ20920.1 acetyl-CoA carboxylase biotin carboxyl carrier protein [Parafilimonas terrae]
MDYKQIQELIKLVNKSNIGELSIEEKDFKILIKQKRDKVYQPEIQQFPVQAPLYVQPQAAALPQPVAAATAPAQQTATAPLKTDNLITIKSPMIGTFYKRPGPDKPNFVEVGDEIAPGKVVCIIEAMKLFNEIESEVSGKIAKILVEDASPVEFDQPLFLVEPA